MTGDAMIAREALNQWHFVIAAYAIGLGGCAALVIQSWLAMRRAEQRRDAGRDRTAGRTAEPAQPGRGPAEQGQAE
ncbi:hypothetical protein [Novosphingobium sp.]|uniref:hypothetical protein n=1 Tax=Novosphingobium sp. TaxID=1874826 RepID=UPI00262628C0|nr:hypothetical protein [Novosphingobium sp.]